ncbi:TPA: hypothetical protein ACOENC_003768 [Stenotrophomonas maltophilia]
MRTPMKFSGKPQSYVKQLEARIAALESAVTALVMVNRSPEFAKALGASADWSEGFMSAPETRATPEFVRDWRTALMHLLTEPPAAEAHSPDANHGESGDPQASSTD